MSLSRCVAMQKNYLYFKRALRSGASHRLVYNDNVNTLTVQDVDLIIWYSITVWWGHLISLDRRSTCFFLWEYSSAFQLLGCWAARFGPISNSSVKLRVGSRRPAPW